MLAPSILVLDSGLGGLSVLRALSVELSGVPLLYVADTAAFPYGKRSAEDIFTRASEVISHMEAAHSIALVVIACNTLSTLCLSELRAAHAVPFVGTVPAIKVAAERSHTKRFTLLATPNTVDSTYTLQLIAQFAGGCVVDRVGAPHLAAIAETYMLDGTLDAKLLAADIAPCFYDDENGITDSVVLGCTHYPFLASAIQGAAPWDVSLIDPAPAIAQQAARMWKPIRLPGDLTHYAFVTRAADVPRYTPVFRRFGFARTSSVEV